MFLTDFWKKKKKLPLKFGYFHFSVSSNTFLTASWLSIFVSGEPSRTILSIKRLNQNSKVIHGLNYEKLSKMMEILMFFVNYLLNHIRNCSVQIKKMKDGIFSFQLKKYFCRTSTDDARRKNIPPPLDLTRILKSYHKMIDRRKFPEK